LPDGLPEVPAEMMESIGDTLEGTPAPAEPTNQVPAETTATPEGETQEAAATDAPDSAFTKLDPNTLPPEVRPYYDSMLSDYTRKTQEAAPWRKLAEETGVSSVDDLRSAAELYAYLQTPENVRAFYEELGAHLGGQAQPATPAAPEAPAAPEFPELDDPAVKEIRAQLDDLRQQLQARDQAAEREQLQWALLGEMNRQEALLKEQHPTWEPEGDEWTAIWNIAPAFDGDLVRAASIIEAAGNSAVTRLLNGKASAAETPGLVPEGPARVAVVAPSSDGALDPDLKNETAAAMEFLRGVVNQSE